MYNFRTDLASERRDLYIKANNLEDEIDWEETAKLNGIPYDSRPTLEEVTKGINAVFINK